MANDPHKLFSSDVFEIITRKARESGVSVDDVIRAAVSYYLAASLAPDPLLSAQEKALLKVWDNPDDAVYDQL